MPESVLIKVNTGGVELLVVHGPTPYLNIYNDFDLLTTIDKADLRLLADLLARAIDEGDSE